MSEQDLLEKNEDKADSFSERDTQRSLQYLLRPDYTLQDFFHLTLQSKTISELTDHFLQYLSKFGLDRFVMSAMSFDGTHQKEKHHGLLVNFPDEWMKHYLENHYIEHDAIYSVAMTARKPFLWHSVKEDIRTPPKGKLILEEAREFKLCDGIGLSIHQPLGEIIGMGLASSFGGVESHPEMLSEIYAAAHHFYTVFSELSTHEVPNEPVRLTPKELEVLLWLTRGKTINEIASVIGVSEATIKFHRSNIYIKLSVDNCRSAITKALRMGLVKPF